MKILFVENFNLNTDNPMSTLYPSRCQKIKENINFDTFDIGNSDQSYDKLEQIYNTVLFGARSLYLYKHYKSQERNILKNKLDNLLKIKNKYFLIQDMHPKTYGSLQNLCEFLEMNRINIIFTFYQNTEANVIRKLTPNCKYYHLPLHIDDNIFNYKNIEKKYDILLYGSIHPRHYPFRKRLFDIITKNNSKFKIGIIDKPESFDPTKCEHGLAEIINQSKITIATKSRYNYFVAKYLEIVFCKSLVAGNMATDGKNIFENNFLELNEQMTDDEIVNKLEYCLKNYSDYVPKINTICDKLNNYNINNYVNKLLNMLKE